MIEQYQQILSSLASRDTVTLATMIEGVSMVTRMLKVRRNATELQAVLAKNGMIETLLDVMKESRLDTSLQKMLLPVIISRISQLLRDCEAACVRMNKVGGYQRPVAACPEHLRRQASSRSLPSPTHQHE